MPDASPTPDPAPPPRAPWPAWVFALAAGLFGVAPWLVTLDTAFLVDSQHLAIFQWLDWKLLPWTESLLWSGHGGGFRPTLKVSFVWTGELFGGDEAAHRTVNFVSHALTTALVWCVGRRLGLGPRIALGTSLVFAWSPCFGFLVPWIAGRPDLHAGCAIAALFLAVAATHGDGRRAVPTLLAVVLAVLACLTKEVVLLVPAALPFVVGGPRLRRLLVAPTALASVALVWIRIEHHARNYRGEIERDYDPTTMLTDPEHLQRVALGASDVFTSLFAQLAPWEWRAPDPVRLALLGGLLAAGVGLALVTWRRGGVARAALVLAALVTVPIVPFLHGRLAYYVYAPAVLLWPLVIDQLRRLLGVRATGVLVAVLAAAALWGAGRQTAAWTRASREYRDVVAAVAPVRERVLEEQMARFAAGQAPARQMIVVEGLPATAGPIELFHDHPPVYLSHGFFRFFEHADPTLDADYLVFTWIRLWGGELPDDARRRFRDEGYEIREFVYTPAGVQPKDDDDGAGNDEDS